MLAEKYIKKIDAIVFKTELLVFALNILILTLLSISRIIIRMNISEFINNQLLDLSSIDVIIRHSLLWITILGASIATYHSKHLHIEILEFAFRDRKMVLQKIKGIVYIFSAFICGLLVYASYMFIEYKSQEIILFNLTGGQVNIILLVGFTIITLRFLFYGIYKLFKVNI